jgi:hypothetical protein
MQQVRSGGFGRAGETNADPLECDRLAGELERLSDPGDAGGLFEVVVQARDYQRGAASQRIRRPRL